VSDCSKNPFTIRTPRSVGDGRRERAGGEVVVVVGQPVERVAREDPLGRTAEVPHRRPVELVADHAGGRPLEHPALDDVARDRAGQVHRELEHAGPRWIGDPAVRARPHRSSIRLRPGRSPVRPCRIRGPVGSRLRPARRTAWPSPRSSRSCCGWGRRG
jgi:hypothetical protein